MKRIFIAAALGFAACQAHAYCVYNETDREVSVEQEHHPNSMRDERRLKRTLAPKSQVCCHQHNLDCNPAGRANSVLNLEVRILGEPAYSCGFPPGAAPNVKVTGAGTIRILPNPRHSAYPYIVRVRTHDRKDLTGPRGVPCTDSKPKGSK
jgi:hypothetical protein